MLNGSGRSQFSLPRYRTSMIRINPDLSAAALMPQIARLWRASSAKIDSIQASCRPGESAPVYTVEGRYTSKGWTEWTQGFQFGSALLQFDATGDRAMLEIGHEMTRQVMAPHLTHMGVHDHGFNNVSTYGNLWRLMGEERIEEDRAERDFYELALRCSGAVQARRWTRIADGTGFIHTFNGPHSLFADTLRSLRSLALGHRLGHALMEEHDERVSLLARLIDHARTTARFSVYYGEGRDIYDVRGRVVHECIFNTVDGHFRCPSTQQGYSPFSTWTRGLAWVMCGYAEQLEFLATVADDELDELGGRAEIEAFMCRAATAVCDFYIANTPTCGVPYWDTGAPGLTALGDYLNRAADPFNRHEPVDSSAAAIAAQGLLRFGRYLRERGNADAGARYLQAGLTVAKTLFDPPYLSEDASHQGLLLHAVYHRPNGWDHEPGDCGTPQGEACMWGDYHARELALYLQRIAQNEPYYSFFGPPST